jgi:xylulokinase
MSGAGQVAVTIDVGGSGVKLSAYSIDAHRSLGSHSAAYDPAAWRAGGSEFDVTSWWATTVSALRQLVVALDVSSPSAFAGITVGAIRIPFVLLDGAGDVVRPCIRNGDRRATAQVGELEAQLGGDALYRTTGHWPAAEFGLPKLMWLRRREPEVLRQTRQLLQLHDWFVLQLSGSVASEPSSAAMSQLLAASADNWAVDLLGEVGVPSEWLPEIRPSGTVAGGLRAEVGRATGLPYGLPVHMGGGDTQLSALGAGALRRQPPAVIVAGTTAPVQRAWSGPPPGDPASAFPLLRSRQLHAGYWTFEANASAIGSTLTALAALGDLGGDALPHAIDGIGLRRVAAGSTHRRLAVTVGNPTFGPDAWANPSDGAVVGLMPCHRGGDVLRSAVEHSALAVSGVLASLRRHAPAAADSLVVTGGLSADAEWMQTLADVTGETVSVPNRVDTAGIGGASVVAGRPLWSDEDDVRSRSYEPDAEANDAYRQRWPEYLRLCAEIEQGSRSEVVVDRAGAR